VREAHFESEEQANNLATLLASVDVVSQKEVLSLLRKNVVLLLLLVFVTHLFEHVQQVAILPMDISKDFHRRFKLNQRPLILKALLSLLNQKLNDLNREVH
jgi:hypothetical protein